MIVFFLLIQNISVYAEKDDNTYPLTWMYPEDYSFRSGLVYKEEQFFDGGKIITYKYWNSRYPFEDPNNIEAYHTDRVDSFVGFDAKIVKMPYSGLGGYVSYNLAMIPFLEATETIQIDSDGDSIVSAQRTEFDQYGNPKITYNLGFTGQQKKIGLLDNTRGAIRGKEYHSDIIRDPTISLINGGIGTYYVNTEHTSLHSNNLLTHEETLEAKRDTRITQTEYVYENDYLTGFYLMPDHHHDYYGYYPIEKTTILDAYENVLSISEYTYPTQPHQFGECIRNDHVRNYTCPKWRVYDGEATNISRTYCIRMDPDSVKITPLEFGTDIEESIEYDECGNEIGIEVSRVYKHPTKSGDNALYKKKVEMEYDIQKTAPIKVSSFNPETSDKKITNFATYNRGYKTESTTNERGRSNTYEYDPLGRIKKVWVFPDVEGQDDPSMKYEYEKISARLIAKEYVKIEEGRYMEKYHFYDGMGRHIQTQTYNDHGTSTESDDTFTANLKVYDGLGRVIREYRIIEKQADDPDYGYGTLIDENEFFISSTWIEYEYDGLGRLKKTIDGADGSEIIKDYSLENDYQGNSLSFTTDPLGNTRTFTNDARGNLVKVSLPSLT